MTMPNHITGGIVFTGLFCSLFTINIFANPIFITVTVIGSLLPDIDHTKSIIGKAFYPLAKYLSVNYGHRTITHSVFFLAGICIISIFIEKNFREDYSISTILFFSVLSHFLFDMVTLQGIPLFYPYYKNPCVLPANPEMRIRSGNIRQEGVILFIFCFLTFFMQDLFHNGFWSTINNNFNDMKHQIKEYSKSNNALTIDYDYNIYQKHYKGKGIYLLASENAIYILNQNKLITMKKDELGLVVKLLKTTKTKYKINQNKVAIFDYSESKLNAFLNDKFIVSSTIYSKFPSTSSDNLADIKKKFEFTNQYDIYFKSHIQDTIIINRQKKITDLELKLKNEENQLKNDNKYYFINVTDLEAEEKKLLHNLADFELNEVKKKIIDLQNKITNYHVKDNLMILEYKKQIEKIRNLKLEEITYSGNLNYIEIIK